MAGIAEPPRWSPPWRRPPRWTIEEVLARTDLARLLDDDATPAARSPRRRRWHCPDPGHDDHHASVTMHTDSRGHERWRCWSGGHRGDAIDLVMLIHHLDRRRAVDHLAARAGLGRDRPSPPPLRRPPPRPAAVALHPAVTRYALACERFLPTPPGAPVRDWLDARGIGPAIARANRVGADPGRRGLHRRRGLPRGTTVAATFPALDPAGDIRYVQARYLAPGEGLDKYDNPSGHLAANPRIAWVATTTPPRPGLLVVTEGIPDGLTAAQAGYATAAILGAQAPDPSVAARLAARAERGRLHIVAVTDADRAGDRWGTRLREVLAEHGCAPVIVRPARGNDLNDWASLDPAWSDEIQAAAASADALSRAPPAARRRRTGRPGVRRWR